MRFFLFRQISRQYSTQKTPIHRVIYSASTNIWFNLATEEWLSNSIQPNEHILFLWQNQKSVIIGRNQNPWVRQILIGFNGQLLNFHFVERMFLGENEC